MSGFAFLFIFSFLLFFCFFFGLISGVSGIGAYGHRSFGVDFRGFLALGFRCFGALALSIWGSGFARDVRPAT